jgi:hypothetical protein
MSQFTFLRREWAAVFEAETRNTPPDWLPVFGTRRPITPISHVSIVIWLMLGAGPAQDRLTVQVSWEHELDEAAVAAVLSNGKLVVIDPSEPSIHLVDGGPHLGPKDRASRERSW